MSMLEVQGLNKSFFAPNKRQSKKKGVSGAVASVAPVLKDINFSVETGELFTLLGPSGCGKSTTLRSIAGLETPDEGSIRVGGRTVYSSAQRIVLSPNARQLSMVFQSYAIWPHLNVFKNVSFPLEVRKNKLTRQQIEQRVEAALAAVQLEGLGHFRGKLSGGQQQRLALARSLVTEPELVLLDEPLSNLDAKLRENMRIELKRLQKTLGLTSVYAPTTRARPWPFLANRGDERRQGRPDRTTPRHLRTADQQVRRRVRRLLEPRHRHGSAPGRRGRRARDPLRQHRQHQLERTRSR